MKPVKIFPIAVGLALVVFALYSVVANDAPGAPIGGTVLMVIGLALGLRGARGLVPQWAARTSLAAGAVIAALVAFLIHRAVVTGPLFAREVPSVMASAPSPQYAAAVERGRALVRAAVLEQNLPGVSVAAGAGDAVVWAEGFGWRDVLTETPVTPTTRFNIGTAASAVMGSVTPLGLTNSGTDTAADWSPSHLGEPEDDFPPFTMIRRLIFIPLGIAPPQQPIPGERATFYVPRSDNNPATGRWLMYMRDLGCCAPDKMASYSTPSDLVRFALATKPGSVDGELAKGMVMSLRANDNGVVVAVASNIAHANTSALAQRVADAFAGQAR